jgi:hypothetical protein
MGTKRLAADRKLLLYRVVLHQIIHLMYLRLQGVGVSQRPELRCWEARP